MSKHRVGPTLARKDRREWDLGASKKEHLAKKQSASLMLNQSLQCVTFIVGNSIPPAEHNRINQIILLIYIYIFLHPITYLLL